MLSQSLSMMPLWCSSFSVGLEIKREMVSGSLSSFRKAMLYLPLLPLVICVDANIDFPVD